MADLFFTLDTDINDAGGFLCGTSTITLLQVTAPTNQRVKIHELSVSFQGTSNTAAPILMELVRQTNSGTMSALALKKWDEDMGETIQSTAASHATAEPATTDILFSEMVHPQTGFYWQAPFGKELKVKGGNRLGMRLIAPGATVTVTAHMLCEE